MKKLIFALPLLFCVYHSSAQTDTTKKQLGTSYKKDTAGSVKDNDLTFTKVEVESEFPGGVNAWISFLQNNLKYPKKALRKNITGTVVLQFIVNKDGTVSDIEAISGPEELWESAINTLKKTPNWIPAYQNGRKVRSYKKQPINYSIQP
jgi:periplasmic protein TonB